MLLGDGESAGSAEHHQVQQGVGAQAVGAVDAGGGRLAAGVQSGHHLVHPVGVIDHLVGGD